MAKKAAPVPDTNEVRLKYMDTEPGQARKGAKTLMQGWDYTPAEPLLDGPVSRRVAVIDLNPDTGAVTPGAKFVPPKGRTRGGYKVKREQSMKPASAARAPLTSPAPISHALARAQKGSFVPWKARSVRNAPMRNAIGKVTRRGVERMSSDCRSAA
jgi:hypothetical protein